MGVGSSAALFCAFSGLLIAGVSSLLHLDDTDLLSAYCESLFQLNTIGRVHHDIYGFAGPDQYELVTQIFDTVHSAGIYLGLDMKSEKSQLPSSNPEIIGIEWCLKCSDLTVRARPRSAKLALINGFVQFILTNRWKASLPQIRKFVGRLGYYSQVARRGHPTMRTLHEVVRFREDSAKKPCKLPSGKRNPEHISKHTYAAIAHEARGNLLQWHAFLTVWGGSNYFYTF